MAYLRVHCYSCGGKWEIYHRDDYDSNNARQCPHCGAKIDLHVWRREVLPAFAAAQSGNTALFKDSTSNNRPLFTFDIKADHIYKNAGKESADYCPLLDGFSN